MANDRIFIRCKFCEKQTMLYKYYPGGAGYIKPDIEALDEFITDHLVECNNKLGYDLGGEPGFILVTENYRPDELDVQFMDMYIKADKAGLNDVARYMQKLVGEWDRLRGVEFKLKACESEKKNYQTTYQHMYTEIYNKLRAQFTDWERVKTVRMNTIDDALKFIREKFREYCEEDADE